MSTRRSRLGWMPLLLLLFLASSPQPERISAAGSAASAIPRFSGRVPIGFEPNWGQADSQIQFLVQQPAVVALGRRGELRLASAVGETSIHMEMEGANPAPEIHTADRLPGHYNHFESPDPQHWIRGVPSYGRVEYRNVYPGIDLAYSGRDGRLEYDFVVASGSDPDAIRLKFPESPGAQISSAGELVVGSRGELRHLPPRAYQQDKGGRKYVTARFVRGPHSIGFAVGPYDRTRQLVIDPTLVYSITLGGSGAETCCLNPTLQVDYGAAMAVDAAGSVYVGGSSSSPTFPPIGPVPASAKSFVLKLDSTGTQVLYGTFFSGNIAALAVDASGNAYITGTGYGTLPVTQGAAQTNFGGSSDAFAAKFNPSGNLIYSTYIGGSRPDAGTAIAVDAAGNAYVAGETASDDLPTVNAAQAHRKGTTCLQAYGGISDCQDAFVTMVNPEGSGFVYSTYLGGTDYDGASGIALDAVGNAYIAGRTNSSDFPVTAGVVQTQFSGGTCLGTVIAGDGFVAKLGVGGQPLVYASYLGGHGCDAAAGIAVDSSGAAYIAGNTESLDFPVTPGAFLSALGGFGNCLESFRGDAFVVKLNPQASVFAYATYLGGGSCDAASAIAVDAAGNAYVTGRTASVDFPMYRPVQPTFGGAGGCSVPPSLLVSTECSDAFITVLKVGGDTPLQSTFLGSAGLERGTAIGVDAGGNIYVMGLVFGTKGVAFDSANFPLVGSQPQSGGSIFIAKIGPVGTPPSFTPNSVTDESGSSSGLIAGATALISGSNLTTAVGNVTASDPPSTALMGTSVTINGSPVPVISLSGTTGPQQIKIQVPPALPAGVATVVVDNNGSVAEVTGVPAGIQIRRTGDAQAGVAEHPLPLPLSVALSSGDASINWRAKDGGVLTVAAGSNSAVWTLGPALGPHAAVALIRSNSTGVQYTVQFTATASAGNTPSSVVSAVLNGAGFDKSPSALSPGMIASVFGTNLSEAPSSGVAGTITQLGLLPTILAGTQVTFDGLAAPLLFANPTQVNVQVPYELAGYPSAQVVITVAGVPSKPVNVPLMSAAPGIFVVNAEDRNLAAALNQDNSINSPANPAPAGSVVQVFCTGLGLFRAPMPGFPLASFTTGAPFGLTGSLFWTADTPIVTIGGSSASVLFSGLAPGFVGLWQVNVKVPAGIAPGEVSLRLSMSGQSANPVTIFVR